MNLKQVANNIPVYTINGGTQDVLMVRLIFKAGIWYQPAILISYMANKLLAEGTKSYTADQLAERIDYYGAEIELEVGQDLSYVTLYCLSKDANTLLPIFEEIVKYPTFPQHELDIFIQNAKQKHAVNQQKVKHVARVNFGELLFGVNHPYGKKVIETDYDSVTAADLQAFHKQYFVASNCTVILAGRVSDELIGTVDSYFGGDDWSGATPVSKSFEITSSAVKQNYMERADAVQSALLIGKCLGLTATTILVTLSSTFVLILILLFKGEFAYIPSILLSVFLSTFEAILLILISMLFSSITSPILASVSTIAMYFIGHAGGDNFIIITTNEAAPNIRQRLKERFATEVQSHYNFIDRQQGFIQAPKAEGGFEKVGFMTFSAGLVSPSSYSFADIREITELAADARRQDAAAASAA